jgi:hypothetical protein
LILPVLAVIVRRHNAGPTAAIAIIARRNPATLQSLCA